MGQLRELQKCMVEVEEATNFKGYWFRISNVLSAIVYGMLCGLENMSEIYDWATANRCGRFWRSRYA